MKKIAFGLILLLFLGRVFAQTWNWDFNDCEIKDILFALSLDTGILICADDTVNGKGDFRFSGTDFDIGFEIFLNCNRLFVKKSDKAWIVSRFCFEEVNGLCSLDCYDMTALMILDKLSLEMKRSLSFESFGNGRFSVHLKDLTEFELLNCLAKRFGNCVVKRNESGYEFCKSVESRRLESEDSFLRVGLENGKLKVDVKNVKFSDVVEHLFGLDGEARNYCFNSAVDLKLGRILFDSISFDEAIRKLCELAGAGFVVRNELYYFFADNTTKDVFVFGKRNWKGFVLKYGNLQEIISLICKKIGKLDYFCLEEKGMFFARVTEEEEKEINDLIEAMDIRQEVFVVNLKYIRPSQLMNHLPPFVDKANLFLADDNSFLYFKGTSEAYENLCQQLEICDRMETRITYDLLILQYDDTAARNWSSGFSFNPLKMGDRSGLSGVLGSVMNLNMNVVAAFGLDFAASLQASIEENHTEVFADTTLHGVNGKEISFQNTSTYRYRDNNLDPDTGKPVYSGVTREIVSGIKIEVVPWISGDGMITSKVTASISRRGTDTSGSTGNPPPTTEKLVNTEVCSKSGEPVILSGLVQSSVSEGNNGIPFISKIPILGKLFKSEARSREKSQMVIILVPRIEGERTEEGNKDGIINALKIYKTILEGKNGKV